MPQTSSNAVPGTDAKSSQYNAVVADLAEIYAGGPGVPIGGWIWWWSDGGSIPLNYKIMDGSAISDGASPLNGLTPPSMVDRFARGVANSNLRSSPVSGGADSVVLTVGQLPAHPHTIRTFQPNANGGVANLVSAFSVNDFSGDYIASLDNAINGVNGDIYNTRFTTENAGSGQAHTNIPAFRGFVPIMRIK